MHNFYSFNELRLKKDIIKMKKIIFSVSLKKIKHCSEKKPNTLFIDNNIEYFPKKCLDINIHNSHLNN